MVYSFDLFVNGVFTQTFFCENGKDEGEKELYAKLYGGENRIQLFFPCLAVGVIHSVELSDGATIRPAEYDFKILMLGDSITQGFDAKLSGHCYANILARKLNADLTNNAIGGAWFRKSQLEYTGNYDVITVAYGTNDWNGIKFYERFCELCDSYFERLAEIYPNAKRFAILPIWREDCHQQKKSGDFFHCRNTVAELAKKTRCHPIGFHRLCRPRSVAFCGSEIASKRCKLYAVRRAFTQRFKKISLRKGI